MRVAKIVQFNYHYTRFTTMQDLGREHGVEHWWKLNGGVIKELNVLLTYFKKELGWLLMN